VKQRELTNIARCAVPLR